MTVIADQHNERFRATLRGLIDEKLVKHDEIAAVIGWESSGSVSAFLEQGRDWNAGIFLALCHGLGKPAARGALRSLVGYAIPAELPAADVQTDATELAIRAAKDVLELLDQIRRVDEEWHDLGQIGRPRLVRMQGVLLQQITAARAKLDQLGAVLDARLALHMARRRANSPSDQSTGGGDTPNAAPAAGLPTVSGATR